MSFWKKLFNSKGKVAFLREEVRPAMAGFSALGTYRYYKASDTEAALKFLNKQDVSEKLFYVCVETPDGRWVKDVMNPSDLDMWGLGKLNTCEV